MWAPACLSGPMLPAFGNLGLFVVAAHSLKMEHTLVCPIQMKAPKPRLVECSLCFSICGGSHQSYHLSHLAIARAGFIRKGYCSLFLMFGLARGIGDEGELGRPSSPKTQHSLSSSSPRHSACCCPSNGLTLAGPQITLRTSKECVSFLRTTLPIDTLTPVSWPLDALVSLVVLGPHELQRVNMYI